MQKDVKAPHCAVWIKLPRQPSVKLFLLNILVDDRALNLVFKQLFYRAAAFGKQ